MYLSEKGRCKINFFLLCSSCGRLKNLMCLLSSPVFKPRLRLGENSDSNEKDALFGLDTQITILGEDLCENINKSVNRYFSSRL
jgi:hypothetical protein